MLQSNTCDSNNPGASTGAAASWGCHPPPGTAGAQAPLPWRLVQRPPLQPPAPRRGRDGWPLGSLSCARGTSTAPPSRGPAGAGRADWARATPARERAPARESWGTAWLREWKMWAQLRPEKPVDKESEGQRAHKFKASTVGGPAVAIGALTSIRRHHPGGLAWDGAVRALRLLPVRAVPDHVEEGPRRCSLWP